MLFLHCYPRGKHCLDVLEYFRLVSTVSTMTNDKVIVFKTLSPISAYIINFVI